MSRQLIDLTSTGLVIGDLTFDWIKKISDGTVVSQSGHTLTERGNGIYIYDNPNVVEDSDFRIHPTATPANYAVGYLSPSDGILYDKAQLLFSLIESQRGGHTGISEMIFWDPISGNDSNSGLIFREPKLTFNFNAGGGVHSLLNNNDHQIIIALPNAAGGPTTVNEYVEIDKAYSFLRGPGRDFLIEATHNETYALKSAAEGIELSGVRVKTKVTGSQDAVGIAGDFTKLHNLWVDYSRGSGIKIDNASSCLLENFLIQDSAKGGSGHAVHILGDTSLTTRNLIGSGKIFENGNGGTADGIRVDGSFCIHNFINGGPSSLLVHQNTGYGINEVNGADETIITGPTIHLGHNALGEYNLTGASSTIENVEQWAKDSSPLASVVAYPGQFSPAFSMRGQEIEYPRKTSNSIPYDLDADLTGLTIKFMAKLNLSDLDAAASIPLKDITSGVTDLTNGLGLAALTEGESNLTEGKYYAEVQALDGAVVVQRWFFRLVIIHNVVDG